MQDLECVFYSFWALYESLKREKSFWRLKECLNNIVVVDVRTIISYFMRITPMSSSDFHETCTRHHFYIIGNCYYLIIGDKYYRFNNCYYI